MMKAGIKAALVATAMTTAAVAIYTAATQFSGPQLPALADSAKSSGSRPDTTGETGTAFRDVIHGDAIDRMAVKQLGPPPAPITPKQLAEIQKTEQAFAALRTKVIQQQEARLKQLGAASKKSPVDRSAGKEG